ncbi:hypothetical protein JEM67_16925 [Serratia sp. PAMC26656]|uniref:hypothetical protein n=1 Tax=Serratia sp. PAMC26656 TaxID=2775909 RepID=UPI001F1FD67C|nr:hypothetical protein [Serratia sp. PAMC26656]
MEKAKAMKSLENDIAVELLERSKLYFEYQETQYAAALDRIRKLEEKGLKVFASLSVIVTAFILIVRFTAALLLNQKFAALNMLICIAGFFTFLCLCSAWSFVFRAVLLKDIPKLPTNHQKMESVFLDNPRDSTYVGLAKQYSKATLKIEETQGDKAKLIGLSFREMAFTAWSFLVFVILVVALAFCNSGG